MHAALSYEERAKNKKMDALRNAVAMFEDRLGLQLQRSGGECQVTGTCSVHPIYGRHCPLLKGPISLTDNMTPKRSELPFCPIVLLLRSAPLCCPPCCKRRRTAFSFHTHRCGAAQQYLLFCCQDCHTRWSRHIYRYGACSRCQQACSDNRMCYSVHVPA